MPVFPTYDGPPLPEVLNPLNPRHYLMLVDWILFKPSRLKQYLHRADAELYGQRGRKALVTALRRPAYHRLLGMTPILALLLSVGLRGTVSAVQGIPMQWSGLVGSAIVVLAVVLAIVLVSVLAGGPAFGLAFGLTVGLAGSLMVGLAFGLVDNPTALVLAAGLGFGMFGSLVGGLAGSLAFGVALGLAYGMLAGLMGDLASCVAAGIGALRAPFYLVQIGPALWSAFGPGSPSRRILRHPALGDELTVLPFPGLGKLLAAALAEDTPATLPAMRRLLGNPFQRWAAVRGSSRHLAVASAPLDPFYQILGELSLEEYPTEPLSLASRRRWPTLGLLWLGEIAGVFIDATGGQSLGLDKLIWAITRPLRGRPHPQIAPLARFQLHLLDEEALAEKGPDLALLEEAAKAVRSLLHGEEVACSLRAMGALIEVQGLAGIAAGGEELAWLDGLTGTPLRVQVLEALRGMGDVATEVDRYIRSTSPATQSAAINRAVGMLDELSTYIEGIPLPERSLLQLIVGRWQTWVAEEAGHMGERALREMAPAARQALAGGERRATFWARPAEPFPNPYKTGDPVYPPLLVGRQDVFGRVQGIWAHKAQPDSIILYGHRRMGKSSILRSLGEYAAPGSLLVYADLKGETAFIEGTQHLLHGLADALAFAAQSQGIEVTEPVPGDYATPADASRAFRRLLRRVVARLPQASLILALDEFEAVDQAVQANKMGSEIYNYLRSLSQEPHIVMVFAGLHTLDEMSRDYQEAFFGTYVNIRVSYLPPEAAERLITRPTTDFALDYHPEVVRRIVLETHGQPLLVQRICQELVNQVNHELFDLEKDREVRVLPEDLTAVLSDEFVRSESRFFEGIWNDQIAGRAVVEQVLQALAEMERGTCQELASATGLAAEAVTEALGYLKIRDLVGEDVTGHWSILIPLLRRWLLLRAAPRQQGG